MDIRKALNPAKVLYTIHQRLDEYMAGKRHFSPWSVEIQPTAICNFDCTYCSYAIRNESGARLDREAFSAFVDDLTSMQTKTVYFAGGGEPLIYRGLDDMVVRLAEKQIKQALITNGSNLKLLTKLADKLEYVLIHIAAFNPTLYKDVMRYEQLEHIFKLPHFLKQVNPQLVIGARIVLVSENIDSAPETIQKLREAGFDYTICTPVADFEGRDVIPHHSAYHEQLRRLPEHREFKEGFAVLQPKNQGVQQHSKCWSLEFDLGAICDPKGDIYLNISTIGQQAFAIGNIHHSRFRDIWGGEKYQHVKQLLKQRCEQQLCNNCRYISYNRVIEDFMKGIQAPHRYFL